MIVLMVFACAGDPTIEGKDSGDTDGASSTDSGDTTDTDTAETTETGETTTDDPGTGPSGTTLTLVPDRPTDGLAVAFIPVSDFETFTTFPAFAAQALTGPITLDPGIPPAEAISDLDGYPDTQISLAIISVWEDDGDLAQESGEAFVSAARVAVWIGGELPVDYANIGLRLGWGVLAVSDLVSDTLPEALDPDAVDLPILSWRTEATFGGTYGAEPDGISVATVPATIALGNVPDTLYSDAPLVGTSWQSTLSGAPPSDHYADVDGDGTEEGAELFLAYADTSAPAGLDIADGIISPACYNGGVVLVYWLERFDVLSNAVIWQEAGLSPGWTPIAATDVGGGQPVPEADWDTLSITAECTF